MTLVSTLQDMVPVGCTIAIITMTFLAVSLIRSFVKTSRKSAINTTPLEISSIAVFVTYILYLLVLPLSRSVIDPRACHIRIPLISVTWTFARASLYFFFVIRCQVSFEGSDYAFSKCLIRTLQGVIIILYGAFAAVHVAMSNSYSYDEENHVCVPIGSAYLIAAMSGAFVILVDFILGVTTVGLYAFRLRTLHKIQKEINSLNGEANDTDSDFMIIARKQCKLAFVSYISSVFFMYMAPFVSFLMLPYVDALINVLCVYCTFSFDVSKSWYMYLCECGGNVYLRCLCCFCCFCCNEKTLNPDELKLAQSAGSNTDTVNSSGEARSATTIDVATATSPSPSV
eukprot:80635_1